MFVGGKERRRAMVPSCLAGLSTPQVLGAVPGLGEGGGAGMVAKDNHRCTQPRGQWWGLQSACF